MTASSVMIRLTHFSPVNGSVQRVQILCTPPFAACSIAMITFFAPATRSIAPPMPLTILPGIIQLARFPSWSTCSAPSTVRSMWPPRTIANESALLK